jgi:hypothetical protein
MNNVAEAETGGGSFPLLVIPRLIGYHSGS